MSQSKAQLTNPLGPVNLSGLSATGVVTATTFIGDGTNLTGIALTGNINTTGIITASAFYGSGANLSGVGLSSTSNINTSGIITAGKFYGDGSLLTNIGGAFTPLTYSPGIGQTNVEPSSNIIITFNKPIKLETGTITLRTDSASGTIIESFDAATSSRLSVNGGVLTIDPTNNFAGLTTHYVVLPAGTIKDTYNLDSNTLIDTYSFTSRQLNYPLFVWGLGTNGQLGLNDTVRRSSPTQIPGTQWKIATLGQNASVAVKTDGTLWAWGSATYGKLGQNSVVQYSSPQQIPGTQWNYAFIRDTCIASKTDGTLWAWGRNDYGALGQNDKSYRSSPVQIPGTQWGTAITSIAGGRLSCGALKTDGTMWVWGYNYYGGLGQSDIAHRSSPVQVPGTQWNKIFLGYDSTWAIKTDGTTWAWGRNGNGQLGQNNTAHRSSPTLVPGTQWNTFSNSSVTYNFAAIKTDGTLWACGYQGGDGRLGQNDQVSYSSPRQIPGTQWSSVSVGYNAWVATKTDSTMWVWGSNSDGQLGLNDRVYYSSPRQIPGTQWYSVSSGYTPMGAIKSE